MKDLKKNGVRLHVIGEPERLPKEARLELENAIAELKDCNNLHLTFALSYGGRAEILSAVQKITAECMAGELSPAQITDEVINRHLWTSYLGEYSDVDFMIRTSGEKRLSNYLLWQASYAEFDFPETLWPDYSVEHFRKSLENFKNRNRRFGGV